MTTCPPSSPARALGIADAQTGSLTAMQRLGSALNLHFHSIVLDGVFHELPDGTLRFKKLPITDADVRDTLTATRTRRESWKDDGTFARRDVFAGDRRPRTDDQIKPC